uniref:Si:ch211-13f8.2 n=1 Tax=Cyprinus carpio TaxID=7962 RepID=A0A8C1PWC0_CYPCA
FFFYPLYTINWGALLLLSCSARDISTQAQSSIVVLARNSEHILPYFLGCIERLDYLVTDFCVISGKAATNHNIDNTTHLYHSVQLQTMEEEEEESYNVDELGPKHWTESWFSHVMRLRQAALTSARAQWADYILFADSDNTQVLNQLIAENQTLVFPLQGYYKRSPHYVPIRNWKRIGCHPAPMIHSTMLIDLRRRASAALAFYPVHHYYLWALDDIMAFAFSAKQAGVQMFTCNKEHYGYLPLPLNTKPTLEEEVESCHFMLFFFFLLMCRPQVVELQQQQVLVLEGDLRFEPSFKSSLNTIREDGKQLGLQWDLPNVRHKRLQIKHPEHWAEGVKNLTVLEAQPLSKMLPVNEFLPVMFNKHPK